MRTKKPGSIYIIVSDTSEDSTILGTVELTDHEAEIFREELIKRSGGDRKYSLIDLPKFNKEEWLEVINDINYEINHDIH